MRHLSWTNVSLYHLAHLCSLVSLMVFRILCDNRLLFIVGKILVLYVVGNVCITMVAQVGLLLIETVSLWKMQYQVAQNENSDLLTDNMLQFCRFFIYLFFCCLQN